MRKRAADADAVKSNIRELGIEFGRVESLARFVNTPSVAKGGVRKFLDKDGNEKTIAKVCARYFLWIGK